MAVWSCQSPGGTGVEFTTYEGATYVFCAPSCRERFEASPRLFLEGIVMLRQDTVRRTLD